MAASPSYCRQSPLSRSPLFTPIPELDKEEEEEDEITETKRADRHELEIKSVSRNPNGTPAHTNSPSRVKPSKNNQISVLCTNCRPTTRDHHKTTIVPIDNTTNYKNTPTPKTLLHNLLLSLTGSKTPIDPPSSSNVDPTSTDYKYAAEELSRKLVDATRKRDQALLDASRMKQNVEELERKIEELKLGLEGEITPTVVMEIVFPDAVADARKAVRLLARFLSGHVRPGRVASLVKLPIQDSGGLLVFVEGILNQVFYNEFEKLSEEDSMILDPTQRCEANHRNYEAIRSLTWEEVLKKGTKHYSQGLSKFCDKKMSEVVNMVGSGKAWPESLLQAFFKATKGVWMVYLLGRCVYPMVPIMKVAKGLDFDAKYMDDVKKGGVLTTPVGVRMMVAPGFYVKSCGSWGVIKCKVVCEYAEKDKVLMP